jgi:hypothetical protein
MTLHFPNFSWRATARYALLPALTLGALTACSDSTGSSGNEPGRINFIPMAYPQAVTPDGKTVMVQDPFGQAMDVYFYDVATKQLKFQTQAGTSYNDIAWGLSNNLVIAGNYNDPAVAGIWSQADGWTSLTSQSGELCDGNTTVAWDIDAAGTSVAGMEWNANCTVTGWLWNNSSGTPVWTALDTLGSPWPGDTTVPSNRPTIISDDGSTLAGFAQNGAMNVDRSPAIWHADGSGFLIPTGGVFTDDCPGEVLALSADGSMAAGTWCQNAFYWTQAGGVVDLGRLPTTDPIDNVYANAIAANGQLIFGTSGNGFFGLQQAWVWTAATGMQSLQDVLTKYFVQVPAGYYLLSARSASADGTVVIGQAATPDGYIVTYVVNVPVTAYGL